MAKETFVAEEGSEDFTALLDEFFGEQKSLERCLAKGYVRSVGEEDVLVDVRSSKQAYIAEGYIPLHEFVHMGAPPPKEGDVVDVYIERFEGRDGGVVLSREQARREAAWEKLEKAFENEEAVEGVIFGRVRGGFTVNLQGIVAFLPGSQIDIRSVKDPTPLMDVVQKLRLLRIDRARNNVVVSRRAVIEESRSGERSKLFETLEEGQVVHGKVKNLTEYGAFIDLGGVDGLLHVTDMSWRRLQHPSELLELDQMVDVKVIRFNRETGRISLGLKQLQDHPWKNLGKDYAVGARLTGTVTSVVDYGAFVELAPGIEGLVHASEMSWRKRTVDPKALLKEGQKVDVMILEVDAERYRLGLGMKQCQENPWDTIEKECPVGSTLEGKVESVTSFGLFVEVRDGVDGIVHAEDLSWELSREDALKQYQPGETVKVKVLRLDRAKGQITLGIKQLQGGGQDALDGYVVGSIVTCEVKEILPTGLSVVFGEKKLEGLIRKPDLSKDRSERRLDRFAKGEKVDAKIVSLDGKPLLSIKEREVEEERSVMDTYGSTDSGATLGEILGLELKDGSEEKTK